MLPTGSQKLVRAAMWLLTPKGREAAFSPPLPHWPAVCSLLSCTHTDSIFAACSKDQFSQLHSWLALYGPRFPRRMKCDTVGCGLGAIWPWSSLIQGLASNLLFTSCVTLVKSLLVSVSNHSRGHLDPGMAGLCGLKMSLAPLFTQSLLCLIKNPTR